MPQPHNCANLLELSRESLQAEDRSKADHLVTVATVHGDRHQMRYRKRSREKRATASSPSLVYQGQIVVFGIARPFQSEVSVPRLFLPSEVGRQLFFSTLRKKVGRSSYPLRVGAQNILTEPGRGLAEPDRVYRLWNLGPATLYERELRTSRHHTWVTARCGPGAPVTSDASSLTSAFRRRHS